MKKLAGLVIFLLVLYGALLLADPTARTAMNHYNLAKRIGLAGVLCLGVTPLIISGGIDLSIGSVVGLCATCLAILLTDYSFTPFQAILAILCLGIVIGFANGILATKLRLQPFVITLCGLFIFRGLSRWLAGDEVKGVEDTFLDVQQVVKKGDVFGVPKYFLIFLVLAAVMGIFLHLTVYGRYLYAIGANEKTAKYSGIAVDRYKILAYVLCSLFAAIYSVLYITEFNSSTPSTTGSFLELYAIAGAVLGGISLRGGAGMVAGVIFGAMILEILPNLARMWGIPDSIQYTVIGAALLVGALVDELLRRRVAK
jgi:ribose transport system permease protein